MMDFVPMVVSNMGRLKITDDMDSFRAMRCHPCFERGRAVFTADAMPRLDRPWRQISLGYSVSDAEIASAGRADKVFDLVAERRQGCLYKLHEAFDKLFDEYPGAEADPNDYRAILHRKCWMKETYFSVPSPVMVNCALEFEHIEVKRDLDQPDIRRPEPAPDVVLEQQGSGRVGL